MEAHSVIENFEMRLNKSAKDFLKETAKWAYFLSILGYIGIGIIVLVALFAGTLFSKKVLSPAKAGEKTYISLQVISTTRL